MILTATFKKNLGLKVLSLFLATLLWITLTLGHEEEARISVPVVLRNIPPNLVVSGAPPTAVELELSGAKIILMTIEREHLPVVLDLSGAGEGTVSFVNLDRRVTVRSGIRIMRVQPATIDLKMVKKTGKIHREPAGP